MRVVTPESAGIPSTALERFYREIETLKMPLHSFMLLRHGDIVTEGWWAPHRRGERHIVYSVSKSITSLAVGFCIEEGLFRLTDRIVDLFPEKIDFTVDEYTRRITVEDLLTMRSGHPEATDRSGADWVKTFLMTPPPYPPGTIFGYDSTATHTLCALVQKAAGVKMMDYLKPRLFDKLGIEGAWCQEDPMGINTGSRGVHLKTEDMAKLGQMLLQKGRWRNEQVVPPGWLEAAAKKQADTAANTSNLDGNPGYGYQFWRFRGDAFGARGIGGQFIVVIPHLDMVWVSTGNLLDDEGSDDLILRLFWSMIAPFAADGPLPENPAACQSLLKLTRGLCMRMPEGKEQSPLLSSIAGRTYAFSPNDAGISSIGFAAEEGDAGIDIRLGETVWHIRAGLGRWVPQYVTFAKDGGWARCAFADDETLVCHVHLARKLGTYKLVAHIRGEELAVRLWSAGWTDFHRIALAAAGRACK